jgi:hypothetical protein
MLIGERNNRKVYIAALVVICFFAGVSDSFAADFIFSPASGSYGTGQNFSINVVASTGTQAANAVSGYITVPTDKLEIVGISKAGSVITYWAQEPTHTNGSIMFEGVATNPGFVGNGKIITVTLRGKVPGSALISFSAASILANDGSGTNILQTKGSGFYTLTESGAPVPVPTATGVSTSGVPDSPRVTSLTHPESSKWYANNDPAFSWELPQGVTGVDFTADQNPTTDPGRQSLGVSSTHTYSNVKDGAWYFHIRFRNAAGWGSVTHFKFNIDTEKPEYINIKQIINQGDSEKGQFSFDSKDATSGVDKYEITIDGMTPEVLHDSDGNIYTTPSLDVGSHTLEVRAIDKAGNFITTTQKFSISAAACVVPDTSTAPWWLSPNILNLMYVLLLLIILTLVIAVAKLRRRLWLAREEDFTDRSTNKVLASMANELEKQITILERIELKRDLNPDEQRLLEHAKKVYKQLRKIGKK